jgi:hypothetical protein
MSQAQAGADAPLVWSREALLESGPYAEPLVANGVRCHGGFDEGGRYRSPRTLHRGPAIAAWQARLAAEGADLIDLDRRLMPPQYPNVAQAKLLLGSGVRDPIVRALTIISIVEGFGAIIRDVAVPDLRRLLLEPVDGTALAHLGEGLFEAHARDESGWREEGGHKQMWEAARDLAFEKPRIPGDVLLRMMGRGGRGERGARLLPELDETLERMIGMMARVLVVEIFAEGTFQWGIELLSDPEVSTQPERAGALVAYVRADESPHVEYLRTALSELRARTLRTVQGGTLPGRVAVDRVLHAILRNLTRSRPEEQRADVRANLAVDMKVAADPAGLQEAFDALESRWAPPARTGFEAEPAAAG